MYREQQLYDVLGDTFSARATSAPERAAVVESMLRMVAKLSRMGAWAVELPSMKVSWSREVRATHEVDADFDPTLDEAIGFCVPEHVPLMMAAFRACAQQGQPFDLELQIRTAKGQLRWVRVLAEAIRDAGGEVIKVQGVCLNLSRRKAAAERQRLLAERLSSTLEAMSDAFVMLDRRLHITFMNAQAELLLECRRDELLGKLVWEGFPAAVGTEVERECRRALAENIPTSFEAFYPHLGKWAQVRIHPSPEGLGVYFHDITEAVQGRQALQSLNEDLEQRVERRTRDLQAMASEMEAFLYSIAHDLRAPLASVNGYAAVLQESEADRLTERGKNYLAKLCSASQRMDAMVSGLLGLAKLAQVPVERSTFDLSACARQILAGHAAADPGRSVESVVDGNLRVCADRLLLQQAMEKLLANAWKFTSLKPHARIQVGQERTPDGETAYFVRDDGAGFDMAYAGRLFEVFSRQHGVTEFPGIGVGLAAVKKIVEKHGGRIWAQAMPGEGATFFFTCPAPEARKAGAGS